ncbi:MAG: glycosyltransferase [Pseudomonadota bacterium]
MAGESSNSARATVIIPTYGYAPYLRWAVASVQNQTIRDLEICIICDGSPVDMVEMIGEMASKDERIQVFVFPKGPRTGEIHRAGVIPQTTGRITCYLCHDDLWFPHHVETIEHLMERADFGHTLHVYAGLGPDLGIVRQALPVDISLAQFRNRMLDVQAPCNYFGLSFGAHTRDAYFRLESGWTVTPEGIWTDLHMWRKFLSADWCRCASYLTVTGLHFERVYWTDAYSPDDLDRELGRCFERMGDPAFLDDIRSQASLLSVKTMDGLQNTVDETKRALWEKDAAILEKESLSAEKDLRLQELTESVERLQQRLEQKDLALTEKQRELLNLEGEISSYRAAMEEKEHQLNALYESTSWRITGPLRILADLGKGVGRRFLR